MPVVLRGHAGQEVTVWDQAAERAAQPYKTVAAVLRDVVRVAGIVDLFRVSDKERQFGAAETRSLDAEGRVLTWRHFCTGEIPRHLRVTSPDQARGDYRTTVQVFERGLSELRA